MKIEAPYTCMETCGQEKPCGNRYCSAHRIFRIEDGMTKAFLQADLFQKIFCEEAEPE